MTDNEEDDIFNKSLQSAFWMAGVGFFFRYVLEQERKKYQRKKKLLDELEK